MRSPWLLAVVMAVAGGAAGASLAWWLRAPGDRVGVAQPTLDEDGLAAIVRRLDRLEEGLGRASPPATTLRGSPDAAGDVRAVANEADDPRGGDIASEVEALKAQIAEIAATQHVLAKHAGLPPPWPSDPAEVEEIRARWQSKLEAAGDALRAVYPRGPDPQADPVGWSRFDDHQRAKAAFEAASDAASLRALSEGEFRNFFTVAP